MSNSFADLSVGAPHPPSIQESPGDQEPRLGRNKGGSRRKIQSTDRREEGESSK